MASPVLYAMPVKYNIANDQTAIALSWRAFGHLSQAHLSGVTGDVTLDLQKDINAHIDALHHLPPDRVTEPDHSARGASDEMLIARERHW